MKESKRNLIHTKWLNVRNYEEFWTEKGEKEKRKSQNKWLDETFKYVEFLIDLKKLESTASSPAFFLSFSVVNILQRNEPN